jgi:hypothetical protein
LVGKIGTVLPGNRGRPLESTVVYFIGGFGIRPKEIDHQSYATPSKLPSVINLITDGKYMYNL